MPNGQSSKSNTKKVKFSAIAKKDKKAQDERIFDKPLSGRLTDQQKKRAKARKSKS